MGYPMDVARLSLNSYAAERRIVGEHNLAGNTRKASRGIAAGSPFATTELNMYLTVALQAIKQSKVHPIRIHGKQQVKQQHTTMTARVFVDDFATSSKGHTEIYVADQLVNTFNALQSELKNIGLPLAEDKTELIATSSIIMKAVVDQVSLSHTRSTCRKLGVDVTYRRTASGKGQISEPNTQSSTDG